MSGMYASNNTWPQYPVDTQAQQPIAHDYTYGAQQQPPQDSLFPQEAYPSHYQPPFNPDYQTDGTSPEAIPLQRQYSGSGPPISSNQSIGHSYYTPQPQSLPPFGPSTPPYLDQQFELSVTPSTSSTLNTTLYTSPRADESFLSGDRVVPIPLSSSPQLSFVPAASQSQPQYYQTPPAVSTNPTAHVSNPKRQRQDHGKDLVDDEEKDSMMKSKPAACTRCKSLKVKCELKTDTDPCKRCLNSGHPCLTPNKKQRRAPPKREHLMNQIREQAAHIQELMGHIKKLMTQLESRNDSSPNARISSMNLGTEFDPTSPVLSSSSFEFSDSNPQSNSTMNPDVQDWINKAKESIEAFGEFVGMDSTAIAKSLVDEDPEDEESSEEDYFDDEVEGVIVDNKSSDQNDSQVGIEVEDFEGEEVIESNREEWSKISLSEANQSSNNSSTGAFTPLVKKKELSGGPIAAAIPAKTSPWGLMADMMSRKKNLSRKGSEASSDNGEVGVSHDDFFRPRATHDMKDSLLSQNIVTPQEVEKLFNIYFENMNLSLSLLDPALYTAKQTYYRSSFLFTVICAIASRYYTERPDLYPQLMNYAQQAAGKVLVYGKKSVEICHGYILLSLYPVATRRWEDDRSWIYLGLAIRLATDLNLHHPIRTKPQNEYHAREMLNRERLWLNCFNLDRSMGSQYGKAPIIKQTDYIACHSETWWESSPFNMDNFDIHLCAYNAELRVMSGFNAQIYNDPNHPTGLNRDVDFEKLATETDDELVRLSQKWFAILEKTDVTNRQNHFRTSLLRLGFSYGRLIALSFGFQHHYTKNHTIENPFLQRCLRAASDVVTAVVDDIAVIPHQRIYLRHGPEAQSVFVTFAASFLVKLLQPKFASYLTTDKRQEMCRLVQKTIDYLGSADIAIDNRHGPKHYARFLEGLLATPIARVDGLKHSDSLTRKKPARQQKSATSQSPEPERLLEVPAVATATPQVAAAAAAATTTTTQTLRLSPSPKPSRAALSFDLFAPILAGSDPFAPASARTRNPAGGSLVDPNQTGMATNTTEYFQQPSFDDSFFQSMQVLPSDNDSMMWDLKQTGFDWMNELQNLVSIGDYSSQ